LQFFENKIVKALQITMFLHRALCQLLWADIQKYHIGFNHSPEDADKLSKREQERKLKSVS